MNNQSIFDIFEYLGICVTDNLESVQKALDDLPANKMAELRKMPEFSSMRKFLYTKKPTDEFLTYVQNIRDLKDPAKQEQLRQEQELERQRQEQLLQQQHQRQPQQYRTNVKSLNKKPNSANGCAKAAGCVILAIGAAICFVSLASLFGPGAPVTLDMPNIINTDQQKSCVEVKWEPVNHADYYVVRFYELKNRPFYKDIPPNRDLYFSNTNFNEEDVIVRNSETVTLERDYYDIKEYTITACSDNSHYKESYPKSFYVSPKYSDPFSKSRLALDKVPDDIYSSCKNKISELDIIPPQKKNRFHSENKSDYSNPPYPKLQATSIKNGAVITWNDVDYVDFYKLEVRIGKKGKKYSKDISINSEMHNYFYIFSDLDPDAEYFFTVQAIPYNPEKRLSSFSNTVSVKPDVN